MKRKVVPLSAALAAAVVGFRCPDATNRVGVAGSVAGRVMVVSERGRQPYPGVALVNCKGAMESTVRSEQGTGRYRCDAAANQPYTVRARAHPYAPGAITTVASDNGADVEIFQFERSVATGDTVLPPSAYERRLRTASAEDRRLLCDAASWAGDGLAMAKSCF